MQTIFLLPTAEGFSCLSIYNLIVTSNTLAALGNICEDQITVVEQEDIHGAVDVA